MRVFRFAVFALSLVFLAVTGSVMANSVMAEETGFRGVLKQMLNPERKLVLHENDGGRIDRFIREIDRSKELKTKIIFSGYCASACTMYLSLPPSDLCLMPGTIFVFHRASPVYAAIDSPRGKQIADAGTHRLMMHYPEWVKAWIRREGGLTDELIGMPYEYAVRYIKPC